MQTNPLASTMLRGLMLAGVTVVGGPAAVRYGLVSPAHAATDLKKEYGDLTVCVEVVEVRPARTGKMKRWSLSCVPCRCYRPPCPTVGRDA
eukprot:20057-Eustigmatos_ZCMA.PRE.1